MTEVTQVLLNWSNESMDERGKVVAALYQELRGRAAGQINRDGNALGLQPTVLVNEAYMRLVKINRIDLNGRTHFLSLSGRVMREVLIDEARRLRAKKRDLALQTQLTGDFANHDTPVLDILEIDEILKGLESIDPLYVQLFEMQVFAGMTIAETAAALDISTATVKRKWKFAVAWVKEHAGIA